MFFLSRISPKVSLAILTATNGKALNKPESWYEAENCLYRLHEIIPKYITS